MIVYPTVWNIFTNSGSLKLTLYNIRIMLRLTMQIILQKLTYFSFHTNPKTFVKHPSFKQRFYWMIQLQISQNVCPKCLRHFSSTILLMFPEIFIQFKSRKVADSFFTEQLTSNFNSELRWTSVVRDF